MSTEKKRLSDWLFEVGQDKEVIDTFWKEGVDAAVTKAIHNHSGGDEHGPLMRRNHCHEICRALEAEGADEGDTDSVHQFWVLVRI